MPIVIAQLSDSHLFADKEGLHHGANVYRNLTKVIIDIVKNEAINYVVFTGDLTQDNSAISYQNFVDIIKQEKIKVPFLFLSGNHDDPKLMNHHLSKIPFNQNKMIQSKYWQICLLDSKSETPAGYVKEHSLEQLKAEINPDKFQLLMMHHHPVDVGYFIDEHGLLNQQQFWQVIASINAKNNSIKAVACGHVHQGILKRVKNKQMESQCVDVYTCPATSVQFGSNNKKVNALMKVPAYQLFYLYDNGSIKNEIITC